MKIIINNTELAVNSCYPYRYNNGKLVLKIEVQQGTITHDELKTLLKENTGDIVATNDDGTQQTYSGFTYAVEITDKNEIYAVELLCQSEAEYQVGILKKENTEIKEILNALLGVE